MNSNSRSEDHTTGRESIAHISNNQRSLRRNFDFKEELIDWVQRAIAYLIFFILLQVTIIIKTPPDSALIPLFALDIKNLVFLYCSRRYPTLLKRLHSRESLNQLCSIAFKIMILIHKNSKSFNALLLIIPIAISVIYQFIFKVSKSEECRYLTWLIFTVCQSLFLITIFNFALFEEKIVDWDKTVLLWPIYIGLGISGILTLGLILISIGTFFSWINNEISLKDLFSTIWLLFSILGVAMSIVILVTHITNSSILNLGKYFCLFAISFLLLFIISTILNLKNLINWWVNFFSNSSIENINIEQQSNETIIHTSGIERTEPNLKKPPHLLIRISSSYFKPTEVEENSKACRTVSLKDDTNEINVSTIQRRTFSGPCKLDETELGVGAGCSAGSSVGKMCEMCCEKFCNAVVMECGHGGICYECCLEMWKTTGICHMCRGGISQVLQIEKGKEEIFKVISSTRAVYYDSN